MKHKMNIFLVTSEISINFTLLIRVFVFDIIENKINELLKKLTQTAIRK